MLPIEQDPTRAITNISELDTETLRGELARALTITAQGLVYLAAVWAELVRRGEDLSNLRSGLGTYLPAIASGRLAPEAVVQFAGQTTLLRRIALLPIEEQRRIAEGEPIPVAVRNDDGEFTERKMPALALTARQVVQIFDDGGRVRTPIEQRQLISHTTPKQQRATSTTTTPGEVGFTELRRIAAHHGFALVKKCSQENCYNRAVSHGLCTTHK